MTKPCVGIIGGSGLYDIEGIKDVKSIELETPFGEPSDAFTQGTIEGRRVVFLPRHGKGHTILPTEINFRANIWGMKKLGVTHIIAVSAVGSMREEIKPLDIVIPDQFYDHTKRRNSTFFGDGIVAHISFADPICPVLAGVLFNTAKHACSERSESIGAVVHKGGTYLCIEGPQFSSRAESLIYRQWGVSVIGMTNVQEAKLAREAEICYTTMALVTDYDCWHVGEEEVTLEMVVKNLEKNVETAKRIIKAAIPMIKPERKCPCATAISKAIVTTHDLIPGETRKRLDIIIGKYLSR